MDYQGIVLDIGATFEHITQAASGDLYLETFGGDTVDNSGDIAVSYTHLTLPTKA